MFANLLKSLTAPEPDPLDDGDARLALTALLVRVARTDGDYAAEEITKIDQVVAKRYGLGSADAQALRREAEALEAEAPDTVRFTRAIKDAVPIEDREGIVQALWSVVLADGERDMDEDALLRLVSSLLGVKDRDSAHARQAAERDA